MRYGAADQWKQLPIDNKTPCTNDVFGDPAPGLKKTCQIPKTVNLVAGSYIVPAQFSLVDLSAASEEFDGNQGDKDGECYTGEPDFKKSAGAAGGCYITSINPGEWIEYDIEVTKAASYDIIMQLGANRSAESVSVLVDGLVVGTVNSPAQGNSQFLPATVWRVPMITGGTVYAFALMVTACK